MEKHQVKKLLNDVETYFEQIVDQTPETVNRAWVVIGSQAVHFSIDNINQDQILGVSNEVDMFLIDTQNPDNDHVNKKYGGFLEFYGECSFYYDTFNFYADPVDLKTAIFPERWLNRLENMVINEEKGFKAYAPEIHDLAISKIMALVFRGYTDSDILNDESKDFSYLLELSEYLDKETLLNRLSEVKDSRVTKEIFEKAKNQINKVMPDTKITHEP